MWGRRPSASAWTPIRFSIINIILGFFGRTFFPAPYLFSYRAASGKNVVFPQSTPVFPSFPTVFPLDTHGFPFSFLPPRRARVHSFLALFFFLRRSLRSAAHLQRRSPARSYSVCTLSGSSLQRPSTSYSELIFLTTSFKRAVSTLCQI